MILSADKRLSQSPIWQIQRDYFLNAGIDAWADDVVPHDISCSPYMARAYAQVAFGYLQDFAAAIKMGEATHHPDQPIYFIELGAGSGRLTFHLMQHFLPLFEQSEFTDWPIKFVLTDFVPDIVDFWQQHEKLRPYVAAGLLDFALFDVEKMGDLELVNGGVVSAETIQNPIILLANYFFDSIPQESFVIEDGQLCENLITLHSTQPEPNLSDPALWDRLTISYEAIPLQQPYYSEPLYDDLLTAYEAHFPDTTLSFPKLGLDCIRFWQQFGLGRVLLLTADRGFTLAESLLEQGDPIPNLHGSFSLMVNYHAITQAVLYAGGMALHPDYYQDNLQIVAYVLGDAPNAGAATKLAVEAALISNGPNDFFALKQAMLPAIKTLSLPQLLSFLRFSAYDSEVFRAAYAMLLEAAGSAEIAWLEDIYTTTKHIEAQYLPLKPSDPLQQKLTQLLSKLQEVLDDQST